MIIIWQHDHIIFSVRNLLGVYGISWLLFYASQLIYLDSVVTVIFLLIVGDKRKRNTERASSYFTNIH